MCVWGGRGGGATNYVHSELKKRATTTGMRETLMEADLNKIVGDFCLWQEVKHSYSLVQKLLFLLLIKRSSSVLDNNDTLRKELRTANKKIILLGEAAEATQTEITQLRSTVDKLHHIIARKYDYEGKNVSKCHIINTFITFPN